MLLLETITASGLLNIRLFYGSGLPNKCIVSTHKISALLLALFMLVLFTLPVPAILSSHFFLIPIIFLFIQSQRHTQNPFLVLYICLYSLNTPVTWIPTNSSQKVSSAPHLLFLPSLPTLPQYISPSTFCAYLSNSSFSLLQSNCLNVRQ